MAMFNNIITTFDWNYFITSVCNVDDAAEQFLGALYFFYDRCFPQRTIRIKSNDPYWMKDWLKVLINDRDRAYNKKQWSKYFRLRNEVCESKDS